MNEMEILKEFEMYFLRSKSIKEDLPHYEGRDGEIDVLNAAIKMVRAMKDRYLETLPTPSTMGDGALRPHLNNLRETIDAIETTVAKMGGKSKGIATKTAEIAVSELSRLGIADRCSNCEGSGKVHYFPEADEQECDKCGGTGFVEPPKGDCPDCDGTGKIDNGSRPQSLCESCGGSGHELEEMA